MKTFPVKFKEVMGEEKIEAQRIVDIQSGWAMALEEIVDSYSRLSERYGDLVDKVLESRDAERAFEERRLLIEKNFRKVENP